MRTQNNVAPSSLLLALVLAGCSNDHGASLAGISSPGGPGASMSAVAGSSASGVSATTPSTMPADSANMNANTHASACDAPGAFAPLVPDAGETCWSFPAHGVSSADDSSLFDVQTGESYSQFYFDVPWPAGSLVTRFGAELDDPSLLQQALVFSSSAQMPSGTVSRNVTGTTLGENAELLALWTPGSCNVSYPEDVAGQLPASGKIMVQWHHDNQTGIVQLDGSRMTICTVPEGSRPHLGGITLLGTEDLGGPIGMSAGKHEFSSSCVNDSGAPITVFAFMPEMRALGRRMQTVVQDARGGTQTIFDQPFVAEHRVYYSLDAPFVLQPGDTLTSTCGFENDTGRPVGFGVTADSEMCFQLAFSYPHAALNNGVISLIGMTNTCW